jgi:hypothetical protein
MGNGGTQKCGIYNHATTGLDASNNYWGDPAGPGGLYADRACDNHGSTITSPFAAKPFAVSILKP